MTEQKFKEIVEYIKTIIKDTTFENHCFVVGGAVRDYVMKNEIKDIDICVDIENGGVLFSQFLYEKGYTKSLPIIFQTYGTSMFHLKKYPGLEIECVQTRGEQYHDKNSRNPICTFADIKEDCFRRDLTINALYINISTDEILDLTGNGLNDIKNGICRVTNDNPDIVFTDDPLRILRVIRFATRFDFKIDDKTWESMVKLSSRLDIISKERIRDEFNKMITSSSPCRAIQLLLEVGAMKFIIPEILETIGLEQNKYHFGDVFEHTMCLLEKCENNNLVVRLSCLLHDIGKIKCKTIGNDGRIHFYDHEYIGSNMIYDILTNLKYPNNIIDEVTFLVKYHMFTKSWGDDCSKMKLKSLRKLQYKCKNIDTFNKLLDVIDADNKSHHPDYVLNNQVKLIKEYVNNQPEDEKMFNYKLPINGNDIMEIMNLSPGKEIQIYLNHCLKIAYSKPNITKEELIKRIKNDKIKLN